MTHIRDKIMKRRRLESRRQEMDIYSYMQGRGVQMIDSVKVCLQSGEVTMYERFVPASIALKLISQIENADVRQDAESEKLVSHTNNWQSHEPSGSEVLQNADSPRDALTRTGAITQAEKITALGCYLYYKNKLPFTVTDVKKQFSAACEPQPGNIARDTRTAVKCGLLVKTNGAFQPGPNAHGIFEKDYVFPKVPVSPINHKRSARVTRQANATEAASVMDSITTFPTEIDGYPEYTDMRTNKDRMLWALEFAKQRHFDSLSVADIDYITKNLGNRVRSKNLSSAIRIAHRHGFIVRNAQDRKVTLREKGEEYLHGFAE